MKVKEKRTDYTKFLDAKALQGKKIGVERKPQGQNQFMHELQKRLICLKNRATVIEIKII
jgi:amidase